MSEKEKKPIYKKWWFWAIIAVLVIAIATSGGDDVDETADSQEDLATETEDTTDDDTEVPVEDDEDATDEAEPDPEPEESAVTIEAGIYEVGADIQPGLYKSTGSVNYWARLSGFSGEFDEIIANGNPMSASHVVEIIESDTAFETSGSGGWFLVDDSYQPELATEFEDGIYIVGVDIEPGRYRSEGGSMGYWARLSGFTGGFDDIIANGNPDGSTIIEISESDSGFESNGNGTWTKAD